MLNYNNQAMKDEFLMNLPANIWMVGASGTELE